MDDIDHCADLDYIGRRLPLLAHAAGLENLPSGALSGLHLATEIKNSAGNFSSFVAPGDFLLAPRSFASDQE